MTSLIVPIACWNPTSHSAPISATCAYQDSQGKSIVAIAYASGHIWVYEVDQSGLKPRLMLLGHSAQVNAMTMGQIEIESLVDKSLVIVTASEDGEINLWDLADGHCLANSTVLFQGGITEIIFSLSNKSILCAGKSNRLVIMDASSLETLKSFDLCRNWISSMSLGFNYEGAETLIVGSYDNAIYPFQFDETDLSFKAPSYVKNTFLNHSDLYPNILIKSSEFDRNLLLTLNQVSCQIFRYSQDSVSTVCTINVPSNIFWSHALFASERDVLIFATNGMGYLYYLGAELDILHVRISELTVDTRCIITDGDWCIITKNKKFGPDEYPSYSTVTMIAIFHNEQLDSIIDMHYFAVPETRSKLSIFGFGQNIQQANKVIKWSVSVGSSFERLDFKNIDASNLSIDNQHIVHIRPYAKWDLSDFWSVADQQLPKITSATTYQQSIVLGYDQGAIRIIPEAIPLFCSPSEIHLANHGTLLHGHTKPVTYLYTDTTEISRKKILISSCSGCTINLWNLETYELLIQLNNQTSPISVILPFPTSEKTSISQVQPGTTNNTNAATNNTGSFIRNKKKVICISKDQTVSIIDLDNMRCESRFINVSVAQSPALIFDSIVAFHHRSVDDLFAIEFDTSMVRFFNYKTCVLERTEFDTRALEILMNGFKSIQVSEYEPYNINKHTRQTLTVYPVYSKMSEILPVLVFLVNIKRLIHDINKGSHSLTPVTSPTLSRARSKSIELVQHRRIPSMPTASSFGTGSSLGIGSNSKNNSLGGDNLSRGMNTVSPGKKLMNMAAAIRVKSTLPNIASSLRERAQSLNQKPIVQQSSSAMEASASVGIYSSRLMGSDSSLQNNNPLDISLIHAIFASMLTWELDPDFDRICLEQLDLIHPGDHISYGIRGVNGNLAFFCPKTFRGETKDSVWDRSASMSAYRQLNIVSLIKAFFKIHHNSNSSENPDEREEEEKENSRTKANEINMKLIYDMYLNRLPSVVGSHYMPASFSILARHWQDPVPDVQEACRMLIKANLENMSDLRRQVVVAFRRKSLPIFLISSSSTISSPPKESNTIASMPGTTNSQPGTAILNKKWTKIHFRSSVILAMMVTSNPNLFDAAVIRDTALSLDLTMREDVKGTYRLSAIDLMAMGFSSWQIHLNASSVIRALVALSGFVDIGTGKPSQDMERSSSQMNSNPSASSGSIQLYQMGIAISPSFTALEQSIQNSARQSLLQIARDNPQVFIQTLTMDLAHIKSTNERVGWLKTLHMFILKVPLLINNYISQTAEAMVKSLDPNVPHMRESLLPVLTTVLGDLVKIYAKVAFSVSSQRLAVGQNDGSCVIYDLRTATKLQVLEGHSKPVTAVTFSSDGKMVATLSLEDNTIKVWQPSGGFFGALAGALGVVGSTSSTSSNSQATMTPSASGGGTSSGLGSMKILRTFNIGTVSSDLLDTEQVFARVKLEWPAEKIIRFTNSQSGTNDFQL